jgi:hypothetical protein
MDALFTPTTPTLLFGVHRGLIRFKKSNKKPPPTFIDRGLNIKCFSLYFINTIL